MSRGRESHWSTHRETKQKNRSRKTGASERSGGLGSTVWRVSTGTGVVQDLMFWGWLHPQAPRPQGQFKIVLCLRKYSLCFQPPEIVSEINFYQTKDFWGFSHFSQASVYIEQFFKLLVFWEVKLTHLLYFVSWSYTRYIHNFIFISVLGTFLKRQILSFHWFVSILVVKVDT